MRRPTLRSALLAIGIMLLGAAPAGAKHAVRHRANTFSGSCELSGTITFTPPLTNTAQDITQHADALGTCSGTFTGRSGRRHQLINAPVSYQAVEFAPGASCDGGADSGNGTLTFPYGSIGFTISETRVVVAALVTLKGDRGGSAAGQANVSPTGNPEQQLAACGSSGLSQAPFDARAATTPSISG